VPTPQSSVNGGWPEETSATQNEYPQRFFGSRRISASHCREKHCEGYRYRSDMAQVRFAGHGTSLENLASGLDKKSCCIAIDAWHLHIVVKKEIFWTCSM
jgi:hypothetical protein